MTGGGWDEVVVGAGSAGAVVAARLAERGDRQVLLLEAGTAEDDGTGPPHPVGAPTVDGRNWDYTAWVGAAGGRRQYPYKVGKGLGGSSAVNGAIALRGLPADFDGWADLGNPAWEWKQVRPFFDELAVPLTRPAELTPAARAFVAGCRAHGLSDVDPDAAGPGVGVVPSNTRDGRRMSTALTHLAPARDRLSVRTGAVVRRVLLRGDRAVGVELAGGERVVAGRVTLAAGAVNTPAILERSGIGDPAVLAAAGIPVLAGLPGVGRDLVDHPAVALWAVPRPGAGEAGAPWHEVMARLPDLSLFLAGNVETEGLPGIGAALGGRTAMAVSTVLLRPTSRGSVHVSDVDGPPTIELHLAETASEVDRLAAGVRLAWSLLASGPLGELTERVLVWTERMVTDDDMLRGAVGRFVCPLWHPVGTARMGRDPLAVVDERFRVHGVAGLAVVDAAAMPTIPSAPTNLTCMAMAERAAAWMD